MGDILIGTASWTDPTLIASRRFYPESVTSAEARLQYYASQFNIVEVDSPYYGIPDLKNSTLWSQRTGEKFLFDIKAFRLFTTHQTPLVALPPDIREVLPDELKKRKNIYYHDLPEELQYGLWNLFQKALEPLDSAKKLGVILFQFPPWFFPSNESRAHILDCKEKLPGYRIAVEFRHNSWISEKNAQRTVEFLQVNNLAYVCVDEPQGFRSSVPPAVFVTSDIGVIRFHGRNADTWEKPGAAASDRFNYLYSKEELQEWVPRIENLAAQSKQLHILFNNNYQDKSVINARQLKLIMGI